MSNDRTSYSVRAGGHVEGATAINLRAGSTRPLRASYGALNPASRPSIFENR